MSTYESYIDNAKLKQEEYFVRSVIDQNEKITKFLSEYQRRCSLISALDEQNKLLRRQIEMLTSENVTRKKQLEHELEEGVWKVDSLRNEIRLKTSEIAKYKEFIGQLETNNEYLKKQSSENQLLIVEAKEKVENLREKAFKAETEASELENETEKASMASGCSKSVSLAMNKSLETFEDLAHDVEKLRSENKMLMDKMKEVAMRTNRSKEDLQLLQERRLHTEERNLQRGLELREEVEVVKNMMGTQERLIEAIQIDLETLREENTYLTERAKKRELQTN